MFGYSAPSMALLLTFSTVIVILSLETFVYFVNRVFYLIANIVLCNHSQSKCPTWIVMFATNTLPYASHEELNGRNIILTSLGFFLPLLLLAVIIKGRFPGIDRAVIIGTRKRNR